MKNGICKRIIITTIFLLFLQSIIISKLMTTPKSKLTSKSIQDKIITIRNVQVILDSDLSELYQVETRVLNQSVKRNIDRFPHDFMFQLSKIEYDYILISQNVISKLEHGGRRKLPFVFTEQGVSMLSSVLKSSIAIDVSIDIIRAFVEMRKFLIHNASVFQRIENVEQKQIQTELKIENILNALEDKRLTPKQGIYFNGQIFDAWVFISELIKSAEKSIILIDNYIDESVLNMFLKCNENVCVKILTSNLKDPLKTDIEKFSKQYFPIEVNVLINVHDRFLIIDSNIVYHIGASLKDLGKKVFGFSKMEIDSEWILKIIASN